MKKNRAKLTEKMKKNQEKNRTEKMMKKKKKNRKNRPENDNKWTKE